MLNTVSEVVKPYKPLNLCFVASPSLIGTVFEIALTFFGPCEVFDWSSFYLLTIFWVYP